MRTCIDNANLHIFSENQPVQVEISASNLGHRILFPHIPLYLYNSALIVATTCAQGSFRLAPVVNYPYLRLHCNQPRVLMTCVIPPDPEHGLRAPAKRSLRCVRCTACSKRKYRTAKDLALHILTTHGVLHFEGHLLCSSRPSQRCGVSEEDDSGSVTLDSADVADCPEPEGTPLTAQFQESLISGQDSSAAVDIDITSKRMSPPSVEGPSKADTKRSLHLLALNANTDDSSSRKAGNPLCGSACQSASSSITPQCLGFKRSSPSLKISADRSAQQSQRGLTQDATECPRETHGLERVEKNKKYVSTLCLCRNRGISETVRNSQSSEPERVSRCDMQKAIKSRVRKNPRQSSVARKNLKFASKYSDLPCESIKGVAAKPDLSLDFLNPLL